MVLVLGLTTTLVNLAKLAGHISTPATARTGINASQLLDDDDFTDGLSEIIPNTVSDYCIIGKRNGIDCWIRLTLFGGIPWLPGLERVRNGAFTLEAGQSAQAMAASTCKGWLISFFDVSVPV